MSGLEPVRELIGRVRARWRRLVLLQSATRAALALSGVLALALLAAAWTVRSPLLLLAVAAVALVAAAAALGWGMWPAREVPSNARVARFIEEHDGTLDDRLVSAAELDEGRGDHRATPMAGLFADDAARRAAGVDAGAVVPAGALRRAGALAAASLVLVAAVLFFGRSTIRQGGDAVALRLFPSRIALEVAPGNVRIPAGTTLTIEARLPGNSAPVLARLERAAIDGGGESPWTSSEMATDGAGAFTIAVEAIDAPFRYRVAAGAARSEVFEVQVARPPRVARIDVEYTYPPALRLPRRVQEDAGDIYAPAGTDVRIRVHAEGDAATGRLSLDTGQTVPLTPDPPLMVSAPLRVVDDGSYRVSLADRDGLASAGDTEYFIRMIEDRPPDVRIVRPARDRAVTRLEEVEIEVEADDDHGIDRLELVYAIGGGAERVVPLRIEAGRPTANADHTLYLEDLDLAPGDFVAYHVRARDVARGKRPTETRSDIFFLEVKPFEQEFALARSQGGGAGGGTNRSVDELVAAQKEIVVATWKLDRRAEAARGAAPEQDVRAVARAQHALKTRVEQTASSFRDSSMRDPRRGTPPRPGGQPPRPAPPAGGPVLVEQDAMTAAAAAMGRAAAALDAVKPADALPPEMDALNHLLRAQADVRRREVTQQQQAGSGGRNRASEDLSNLFDRELRRQQQTNYETPTTTEQRDGDDAELDRVRELARRQDEALRRQQELARQRDRMAPDAVKRELERLTREQNELRQRAEELTRRLEGQGEQSRQGAGRNQQGAGRNQQGAGQNQQGAGRNQQGAGQNQQGAGQNQQGAAGNERSAAERMREAARAMGAAAAELGREDPRQASASGGRALQELQALQQQLQAAQPDERRRALGELQLEARQLAGEQREIAAERRGAPGEDARRRLAGDQDRLAERVRRLQRGLDDQAGRGDAAGGRLAAEDRDAVERARDAAREASRDIGRQKLAERMEEAAAQLRGAPSASGSARAGGDQEEVAGALDRLADRLADAVSGGDEEARRTAAQLDRMQELREEIDRLTRQAEQLANQAAGADAGASADAARLRDDYVRRLQEARELLEQVARDNPSVRRGGLGFTFEGQGMVTSAPGTEPFKQDFARWEQLRRQVTLALDGAAAELSRRLQARDARDRLAAGADDRPPRGYEDQVDSYFKSLADRKQP